jgi:hypothetical protein
MDWIPIIDALLSIAERLALWIIAGIACFKKTLAVSKIKSEHMRW